METSRHIRLFRNGRNQALRIPREFELAGNEATIRKEGDKLIIEPVKPKGLLSVLAGLKALEEDFPNVDEGLSPVDDIEI